MWLLTAPDSHQPAQAVILQRVEEDHKRTLEYLIARRRRHALAGRAQARERLRAEYAASGEVREQRVAQDACRENPAEIRAPKAAAEEDPEAEVRRLRAA